MDGNYLEGIENRLDELYEVLKQLKEENIQLATENLNLKKIFQSDKEILEGLQRENAQLTSMIKNGGLNSEKEKRIKLSINKILRKLEELRCYL